MDIPKFNPKDWDEMDKYLQDWDKWKHDTPDGTGYEIYTSPLKMALLKNAEETGKLNRSLLWLTIVLIILSIIMAIPAIKEIINGLANLLLAI